MFFKQEENHDKEYMTMKDVRKYTGLSRSYLYHLRAKGILKAVEDWTGDQVTYKYLTKSVLEIIAKRDAYLELKMTVDRETKKVTGQMREELRRKYYGS